MARQTPAAVKATKAGTAVTPTAPVVVDGDAIPPNSILRVATAGTACTLTVDTPGTGVDGVTIGQYTVTLPATGVRLVGPFPDPEYRQTTGATAGLVHIDYSTATGVTREVINP
jgi:hypothetical protein